VSRAYNARKKAIRRGQARRGKKPKREARNVTPGSSVLSLPAGDEEAARRLTRDDVAEKEYVERDLSAWIPETEPTPAGKRRRWRLR